MVVSGVVVVGVVVLGMEVDGLVILNVSETFDDMV